MIKYEITVWSPSARVMVKFNRWLHQTGIHPTRMEIRDVGMCGLQDLHLTLTEGEYTAFALTCDRDEFEMREVFRHDEHGNRRKIVG